VFLPAENIFFRRATLADAPLLWEWRRKPHVARWWNVPPYEAQSLADVEEELAGDAALSGHESLVVLLDGAPIGYAQTYNPGRASGEWWPDENDSTRGLDLLVGEESLLGRGLGPRIVRALCERLFEDAKVESIIVDPHPDNARSIRCFEKAGFERERQMETPDGDAVLMRVTANEFAANHRNLPSQVAPPVREGGLR